jgi:hypothetical protein
MAPKILIILSILGILILIFTVQANQKIESGEIKSIEYSGKKITIELKDRIEKLVIFDNKIFDIKKGDNIEFIGTKDTYKQEKQIIIAKIWKLS